MDAIDNLINRSSSGRLDSPIPNREELDLIYQAALRAPDHKGLKPSRFIEVSDDGLDKLSNIFVNFLKKNNPDADESVVEKYRKMPYRAPLIIILVSNYKENMGVPEIEQMMSTACSAQSILLALNALHYSGMWRTGKLSFNESISDLLGLQKNETVIGYLYVGTNVGPKKQKDKLNNSDFVEIWS
jgi:nitroreductase